MTAFDFYVIVFSGERDATGASPGTVHAVIVLLQRIEILLVPAGF